MRPERLADAVKRNRDDDEPEMCIQTPMHGSRKAVAAARAVVATAAAPPPLPPSPPPLAHASFGSTSPDAPLVFFNHGWPGSRLGAAMLHRAALKLNVRVVGVDRPGFGGTPFCASHDFASWGRRLAGLADQLGAKRYAVLGVSGGGPFALAAARHAPDPARVAGLGLLCPVAPPPTDEGAAARVGRGRWWGCFGGGGGGGGGGVDEAAAASTASPTTTASWALRAAERHPRTARAVLLVARALLASSSSSLSVPTAPPQPRPEQQHQRPPWPARLLQRAAMGGREAYDAGGGGSHSADIWRAVAEGLRGGGRGMLHEIRLVSRAGSSSASSLASSSSFALTPSLPSASPPGSPLAPDRFVERGVGGGTGGGGAGGSDQHPLFLGGGTAASPPLPPAPSSSSSSSSPQPQFVAFCWHGTDDKVAPAALAEHYYGRLAGCEFRAFEGETHTSLVLGRLGQALGELVRRGGGGGGGGGGGR